MLHRLDGAFVEGEQRVSILAQAVGRRLVGMKVIGSVNLGFVLIALNYLLSWLLAILYGRIAQSKFDPLAARAVSDASEGVPK